MLYDTNTTVKVISNIIMVLVIIRFYFTLGLNISYKEKVKHNRDGELIYQVQSHLY